MISAVASKRGDLILLVALLCIKELRCYESELPEKFLRIGPALVRQWAPDTHHRRARSPQPSPDGACESGGALTVFYCWCFAADQGVSYLVTIP